MDREIKKIRLLMSRTEALIQLAEEASELAIASLNVNRKVPFAEWMYDVIDDEFLEEIADVKLCIDIAGDFNAETFDIYIHELEIFEVLAKYCCELSKAAIKLRRTIQAEVNPTPVKYKDARADLVKKISNVKSCINCIGDYWDCDIVNNIYKTKALRCIDRYNQII